MQERRSARHIEHVFVCVRFGAIDGPPEHMLPVVNLAVSSVRQNWLKSAIEMVE